ncbi:MAG TPA: hypothetical protein PL041_01785 [Melioribacteraceae bacterium]|nr:hypothetical protein [Melioribacteraceae bacterium]
MENKIILIFLVLVFAFGCNKPQLDSKDDNYTIFTKSFENIESAQKYKTELNKIIKDSVYIRELINKEKTIYGVFVGSFEYNYYAGLRAYELSKDSVILSHEIFKGDSKVNDQFQFVPFLTYYKNRGSIFMFDIAKKSYTLKWNDQKMNIISLNGDETYQNIYFLTGKKAASKTGYPMFSESRLYKFIIENNSVKKIDDIGNFVQIFTDIETNNSLKVIYQKFNENDVYKIDKITNVYTPEGVKVESKFETFNLLESALPQLTTILIKVKSNLNKHFIDYSFVNNTTRIFYKNLENKESKYITSTDFKVKSIDWTYEDRYCIIYLEKLNNDMITNRLSSMVVVYDTKIMEMINVIENPYAISYILRGDYLFYEVEHNNTKKIVVWDLNKRSVYHEIIADNGCGLKTLKIVE